MTAEGHMLLMDWFYCCSQFQPMLFLLMKIKTYSYAPKKANKSNFDTGLSAGNNTGSNRSSIYRIDDSVQIMPEVISVLL